VKNWYVYCNLAITFQPFRRDPEGGGGGMFVVVFIFIFVFVFVFDGWAGIYIYICIYIYFGGPRPRFFVASCRKRGGDDSCSVARGNVYFNQVGLLAGVGGW
jgi:hypothetical protein